MSGTYTVTVTAALDARLYDRLVRQSRKAGLSRRALIANAIESYLRQKETEKPVDAWMYEPVAATLLDRLAFVRANDIKTKGELVGYLVVHKGWSHDAAVRVVEGGEEIEIEGGE